jgi:hypothetical protein
LATKICPECGAEVPAAAARCKECFHDFGERRRPRTGPIVLLGALAAMSVLAALTFWYISLRPLDQRILVDESTQSVVFTTHYRSGPRTKRLDWNDIVSLEHLTTQGGKHRIIAITTSGDRVVIQYSNDRPLTSDAEHYAEVMDKPLQFVDKSTGFGKD